MAYLKSFTNYGTNTLMATKEEIMAKAYAKKMYVFELREKGLTFLKIAEKLKVSTERAYSLYKMAKRINDKR